MGLDIESIGLSILGKIEQQNTEFFYANLDQVKVEINKNKDFGKVKISLWNIAIDSNYSNFTFFK